MNLAQELYLCALDGSPVHSNKLPPGIGGALLADLQLRGKVRVGDQAELIDPSPAGDPVLDSVLEAWRDGQVGEPDVRRLVSGLGVAQTKNVIEQTLADGLAAEHQGEKRRLLPGHKSAYRLPTEAGEEPRRRVRSALLGEARADERTAVLATLVDACGLVGGLVPKEERKGAERRARSLAEADAVPAAVREVIRTVQTSLGQTVTHAANPPG